MKILTWIKHFILHLIKRLLQIIFGILFFLICGIIYIVTYEPGTRKKVTPRKVRRIRFLTKVKLHFYKILAPYWGFQECSYLTRLYNRFHFLIDE